jgi:hypothetical protein
VLNVLHILRNLLLDLTFFEGGVCGIVVNEIEAFSTENITETEIANILKQDICSLLSGSLATICDDIIQNIPDIVPLISPLRTNSK